MTVCSVNDFDGSSFINFLASSPTVLWGNPEFGLRPVSFLLFIESLWVACYSCAMSAMLTAFLPQFLLSPFLIILLKSLAVLLVSI